MVINTAVHSVVDGCVLSARGWSGGLMEEMGVETSPVAAEEARTSSMALKVTEARIYRSLSNSGVIMGMLSVTG